MFSVAFSSVGGLKTTGVSLALVQGQAVCMHSNLLVHIQSKWITQTALVDALQQILIHLLLCAQKRVPLDCARGKEQGFERLSGLF
jgi:hypothetical protein